LLEEELFRGKVAIITGGAKGIGLGLARACLRHDMKVVLASFSQESLDRALQGFQQYGDAVSACRADVRKNEEWAHLVRFTLETYGAIDYLFNNAGVSFTKEVDNLSDEEWQWIFDVNFWGCVYGYRHVKPVMAEQAGGGHISFTTSISNACGQGYMVPYGCTKSALQTFAEGVYEEIRNQGLGEKITISTIIPANVITEINHNESSRPENLKDFDASYTDRERGMSDLINEMFSNPEENRCIDADTFGERVLDCISRGKFYVMPRRNLYEKLMFDRYLQIRRGDTPPDFNTALTQYMSMEPYDFE